MSEVETVEPGTAEAPKRKLPAMVPVDELVGNLKRLPNGLQLARDSVDGLEGRINLALQRNDEDGAEHLRQMKAQWETAYERLKRELGAEASAVRMPIAPQGQVQSSLPAPPLNAESINAIASLGGARSDLESIRTILGTGRDLASIVEAICQVSFAGLVGAGWRDHCPALHRVQMQAFAEGRATAAEVAA